MQTIDVQTLANRQSEHDLDVIDVRTPAEYRELHAIGATCVPLDTLDPQKIAADRNAMVTNRSI